MRHGAHRGSSSDSGRRSLRIWVSAVAARANNFAMLEANRIEAYGSDGAGLRTGDQDNGGASAGLSSSMMISEPLTCALARGVDLDKAGSFPV